jgi:hypothetical protein
MVIVAGHIAVEPEQRESYLAGCVRVTNDEFGVAVRSYRTTAKPTRRDLRS